MTIKVGDRVRIVKNYYGTSKHDAPLDVGAVGTVGAVYEEGYDYINGKKTRAIGVYIDGYKEPLFNEGGWGYPEDYVEVIDGQV